ncbi:MAG: DUF2911 domain-containing protein [Planctomycetes bacterium]|nr:DUF2911 domain-containing protein [Planctomycetota bacterium]
MTHETTSRLARPFVAALVCLVTAAALPAQEPSREPDAADLNTKLQQAIQNQQWATAETTAAKLVDIDADDANAWFQLGYSRHAQKKYDRALEAHVKAASFEDAATRAAATYNAACVYALQSKIDDAFVWLDKAVDAGFSDARLLKSDSDLNNLHTDERFEPLIERVSKRDAPAKLAAFSYTTPRKSTRLVYFPSDMPGGQIVIEYAAVPWSDKYAGVLDDPRFVDRRWRFGADAWTNLDTSVPVTIGGHRIEPGYYYLTLTHKGEKKCVINVLDAAKIRASRVDPVFANTTKGGGEIPLAYESTEDVTDALAIDLAMDSRDKTRGALVVRFGTHRLSAPIQVELGR